MILYIQVLNYKEWLLYNSMSVYFSHDNIITQYANFIITMFMDFSLQSLCTIKSPQQQDLDTMYNLMSDESLL